MIGNLIPKKQREEAGRALVDSIYDWSEFPINPENGEVQQALICYEEEGKKYNAIAFFDADMKAVRFERILPAESIIDNILNSF
nr:hypothetical protein [uncultured Draconibacterium sp.]